MVTTISLRRQVGVIAAFAYILGLTALCWAGSPAGVPALDAFSQNKRLGKGVNVLSSDPIWRDRQKARFQEKHFRLIKEASFDHIRVNLHPFRNTGMGADYKIRAEWFETLDWIVQQALANRLIAILDLHEFREMGRDPEGNRERFLAAWQQIAERYQKASDDVFFEILNEPSEKLTSELWNALLREALDKIRLSNPHRMVIVGPTSYNKIKDLDQLSLPDEDRNLIVTVHYYNPFPFTHQGAYWTSLKDKTGVLWNGTPKEQQAIINDFDKAQAWCQKHRRPLYLGEFGAYDKAETDSRVRWTSFVVQQARQRDWSWAWWQFDSDFILYDMQQDHWVEPIRAALMQ